MMDKIKRFFMNRYGTDMLNKAMTVTYIFLLLLALMYRSEAFFYPAFLLAALSLYRSFSKNFTQRSKENRIFLLYYAKVKNWFKNISKKMKDKTHKYFKCPSCKTEVRVPKGKGKIRITCPKCKEQFIKKT